ncbi:Modulator of FtsH protease HflK [Candidatus Cyrtobacter comes]|uniref:Protein HflK n=1 Tax=Candidatus Cyrtobacter comes TaxID=675776 RepID=A0ABU5L6I6_9RICK|nr:FtsH protease activity modulator HflK [Candidatus Cyrtobacter comes]MDZ5761662.1 Modulator of FtsH protease HflK [Candidatus Cyrtobacter comes]
MSFDNPWKQPNKGASQERSENIISEIFKKRGERKKNTEKFFIWFTIIASLALWLSTGFYIINADEQGVVLRLGRFERISEPGLNYKIPYPIETVEKLSVTTINKEVIGIRQGGTDSFLEKQQVAGKISDVNLAREESQMLTGDENIMEMHFYFQWRIRDPKKYLFNIRDLPGESTPRAGAESAMRQVIGVTKLNEALSEQRRGIEKDAMELLQKMLDSYDAGIQIENLGILYSYVPLNVMDAYRDVQSAKANKEEFINQAYAYRNDLLPRTRGEADAIVMKAEAYKAKVVEEALGQAARFEKIYNEYKKFGQVAMDRMYIDTMSLVFKDLSKVIIDKSVASSALPVLQLSDFMKKE